MVDIILGLIAAIGTILGIIGLFLLSERIEYNNLRKKYSEEDACAIWRRINKI